MIMHSGPLMAVRLFRTPNYIGPDLRDRPHTITIDCCYGSAPIYLLSRVRD